ncbi:MULTISPECIES: hypothetical protein [Rhodococcus]|uniref:hypothetical protein n=1 Tax=Rhodococcus TaxID=1827 RepID=UPI000A62D258|nr:MULTISPECIES: hypothetical protein [Rhodococcus]WAM11753.1 hypothetical protein OYT95_20050 [Rhodococcus sp. JS3073]
MAAAWCRLSEIKLAGQERAGEKERRRSHDEDARVQKIYAGANEVMKGIIAKSL